MLILQTVPMALGMHPGFVGIMHVANRFLAQNNFKKGLEQLGYLANHYGPRDTQLFNLAFVLSTGGFPFEAMLLSNTTVFQKARNPSILELLNISLYAAKLGDFMRAWPLYKNRCGDPATGSKPTRRSPMPEWHGEPLAGKTVLLLKEHCFGDLFQSIGLAKFLKKWGANVILETFNCLKPLFNQNKDLVDKIIGPNDPLPQHDYCLPLMDLLMTGAVLLDREIMAVPYISPPNNNAPYSKREDNQKKEKLHVGLFWYGIRDTSSRFVSPFVNKRTIPTEELSALLKTPSILYHSLQKDLPEEELKKLPLEQNNLVMFGPNFDKQNGAFVDSTTAINSLDCIATIDTAITHLAGALGETPIILLVPQYSDWRWMINTNKSPWYPRLELIRQDRSFTWDSALEQLAVKLFLMMKNKKRRAGRA